MNKLAYKLQEFNDNNNNNNKGSSLNIKIH